MKKFISLALSIMAICSLSACDNTQKPTDDTVTLKYYASERELAVALSTGKETVALISEPILSELLMLSSKYSIQLDVQELYGWYPQDVVVAKQSVIESDSAFISTLCTELPKCIGWLKNNVHDGVAQVKHNLHGINGSVLNSYTTNDTVERLNIAYKSATDAKSGLLAYLQDLNTVQANTAIIPDDAFFYNGTSECEDLNSAYTIVTPDGTSALSLSQLMYFQRLGQGVGRDVTYKVVAPETIGSYVGNADDSELADIAVLPVLEAMELLGDGAVYQMLGVVTCGNYYIVSNETIASVSDLQGKTIAVAGEGEVGDLTWQYVLKTNQLVYEKAE